jgi:hypothetical protein
MNEMHFMELKSTNNRIGGLSIYEDTFLVLKPAGIIGGCGGH